MAIETWMVQLKSVMAEVEGIEQVHIYDELPGSLMAFPCLVILPLRGEQEYGASAPGVAIHEVQMTLYVASQVLPEANGRAVPFIKKIRDQLAGHAQLNGSVNYILPASPFYEGPGGIQYGDKTHTGIIFRVRVKETEAINVVA